MFPLIMKLRRSFYHTTLVKVTLSLLLSKTHLKPRNWRTTPAITAFTNIASYLRGRVDPSRIFAVVFVVLEKAKNKQVLPYDIWLQVGAKQMLS